MDKITAIYKDLIEGLDAPQLQCDVKIYPDFRYGAKFKAALSPDDMRIVISVGKKHDTYVEVTSEGIVFSCWLPYMDNFRKPEALQSDKAEEGRE